MTPDNLANAAEELAKLTGHRYQKVGGSRAIGPHLDIDNYPFPQFCRFRCGSEKTDR